MSEVIYDENLPSIEEAEKEVRLVLKVAQEQEYWKEQRKRVEQYYDEEISKLKDYFDLPKSLISDKQYYDTLENLRKSSSNSKGKHKSKEQRFWNNYQDKKDRINELLKRKDRR